MLYKIFDKLKRCFSTIWMNIVLKLQGIRAKGASFVGLTRFYKAPGTEMRIGNNCEFRSSATSNLIGINRPCIISTISPGAIMQIGNNCGFSGTVIGCFDSIVIGNNVKCGANTLITDSDWHLDDPRAASPKPVVIGNNVWLGEGCKILKGVVIGDNTVIGAGAVVTKTIPANVIAGGNPCKVLKTIE